MISYYFFSFCTHLKDVVGCVDHVGRCFTPEQLQTTQELFLEEIEAATKKIAAMIGYVDPIDFEGCPVYQCVMNDDCDYHTSSNHKTVTIIGATAAAIVIIVLLVVIYRMRQTRQTTTRRNGVKEYQLTSHKN